jgi:hypothetical protein
VEEAAVFLETLHNSPHVELDDWLVDNVSAVVECKREKTKRITEMWPAVKKRRQVRPRSPVKGRSGKRAKPRTEVSMEAVETLPPSTPPLSRSPSPLPVCRKGLPRVLANQLEALSSNSSGLSKTKKFGNWNPEEDALLNKAVYSVCGESPLHSTRIPWSAVCLAVPGRNGKQCRERFVEHLDTNIDSSGIVGAEARLIHCLFEEHGRQWSKICKEVNAWRAGCGYNKARAGNSIKNFVMAKTCLVKKRNCKVPCPTPEPISSVEPADVLALDAMNHADYGGGTMDKELEALLQGMSVDFPTLLQPDQPLPDSGALADVDGVPATAETAAATSFTRRAPGFYESVNAPPRTCGVERKIQVRLSERRGCPRRSMFESINAMVNSPLAGGGLGSAADRSHPQTVTKRRHRRATTLSAGVEAPAWVGMTPLAEC